MPKMSKLRPLFLLLLLTMLNLFNTSLQAQDSAEPNSTENNTIIDKFDNIVKESNSYLEFKVIKKTTLQSFKGEILDSLKDIRTDFNNSQDVVFNQKKEIGDLKAELAAINQSLESVEQEKNSITFFGSQIEKSKYKGIMWSIIGSLIALLLFFLFRFIRSNIVTRDSRKQLQTTQSDFEEYKKTALKREQKLSRSLQDELNKRL